MPDPTPTDSDLLHRAREGDADAYAELYRRHHGTVLATAVQTVGPRYAEDLAAEAFTRTLRLIQEGAGPTGPVRPYRLAARRNGRISDQRTNRRVTPVAEIRDVVDDHSQVPQPETPDWLDSMLVRNAFKSLPPRWRAVLWLGLVEDRPVTEVAALLGLSPSGSGPAGLPGA
jgi:RNA polymerase sigma factor (sigma-70 family)